MIKMTSPHYMYTETLFESVAFADCKTADVTIIVTLFDLADYVEGCLDSTYSQTIASLELIVIDDQSTDVRACELVSKWMRQHSERFTRCVLLRHRRNRGVAQARNSAFRHASADFIFVLDADNEIMPRCIERLHAVLHGSKHGAAYSQLELFDQSVGIGDADIWNPTALKTGNYIDVMALISRWAWEAVGGYSHIEGGWEDYDFWCKFVEEDITCIFVPEILSRYRVRENSMLGTETKAMLESIKCELSYRHPWLDL